MNASLLTPYEWFVIFKFDIQAMFSKYFLEIFLNLAFKFRFNPGFKQGLLLFIGMTLDLSERKGITQNVLLRNTNLEKYLLGSIYN